MTPIEKLRQEHTCESCSGRYVEPERNLTALIAATGYLVVLIVIAALVMFGVPFALSLWAQP